MKEEIPGLLAENCAPGGHKLKPKMMGAIAMFSFSIAHECLELPIIAANLHRVMSPRQSQIWAMIRKEHRLLQSSCPHHPGWQGILRHGESGETLCVYHLFPYLWCKGYSPQFACKKEVWNSERSTADMIGWCTDLARLRKELTNVKSFRAEKRPWRLKKAPWFLSCSLKEKTITQFFSRCGMTRAQTFFRQSASIQS